MPNFTNKATLTYNGNTINSNIVTGEIKEVLSATKTAITDNYVANDDITYVLSIVNVGDSAYTNLTVNDNLGKYTYNTLTLVPLTYVANSIRYYQNGNLQTAPDVSTTNGLAISGIDVPADGNTTIIYEVKANKYAPLGLNDGIENIALVYAGESIVLEAKEIITTVNEANLTISKNLSPTSVVKNGTVTYTFTIQNSGNTAAVTGVKVEDIFEPRISLGAVKFNDTAWVRGDDFIYEDSTGEFESLNNKITVPAATYTRNPDGSVVINPGYSTLTITGTV